MLRGLATWSPHQLPTLDFSRDLSHNDFFSLSIYFGLFEFCFYFCFIYLFFRSAELRTQPCVIISVKLNYFPILGTYNMKFNCPYVGIICLEISLTLPTGLLKYWCKQCSIQAIQMVLRISQRDIIEPELNSNWNLGRNQCRAGYTKQTIILCSTLGVHQINKKDSFVLRTI